MTRPLLALLWLCFILRGCFYCSFLPLWEGYDEWSHFAVIQELVTSGRPLVDRAQPVSLEVETSKQLAPANWPNGAPYITHDNYWRLNPVERESRIQKLRALPAGWGRQTDPAGPPVYEALQAPLYYWIAALVYRPFAEMPLLERVFLLRYFSILICSFAIPIIYLIARRVFECTRTALLIVALTATLPELMVDVARVGNECLGVLLFSWLTLLAFVDKEQILPLRRAVWTGVALGLGLLTKAYFLTCIPALAVLYLCFIFRRPGHRLQWACRASLVFLIAFAVAGWWYLHNRITTGTWSGLLESGMLVQHSFAQFLKGVAQVDWRNAVDSILLSHIWFGAWSSLHLRSWIYHVIFAIIAAGIAGVAWMFWTNPKGREVLLPLLLIYAFYWAGQLYNVLLLFLSRGASTSMGWYMYCVVAPEVILLVTGLQFLRRPLPALIFLAAALDIYTVHFISIPYYTGLVSHLPATGSVPVFHLAQLHQVGIAEVLNRLSQFKPDFLTPNVLAVGWLLYLLATMTLVCLAPLSSKSADGPICLASQK